MANPLLSAPSLAVNGKASALPVLAARANESRAVIYELDHNIGGFYPSR